MPQRHRPELSESVVGEPLVGYRRAPRTFRPDRVCETPGCSTRLSIYNDTTFCSTHGPHQLWARGRAATPDVVPLRGAGSPREERHPTTAAS